MQQKVEETQREKEELVKKVALVQQEKEQLEAEKENLKKECEQEKETCAQLRRENQVSWGEKIKPHSRLEEELRFVPSYKYIVT